MNEAQFNKLLRHIKDPETKALLESWRRKNIRTGETEYLFPLVMLAGMRINTRAAWTIGILYVHAFERMRDELLKTPNGQDTVEEIMEPLFRLMLPGQH